MLNFRQYITRTGPAHSHILIYFSFSIFKYNIVILFSPLFVVDFGGCVWVLLFVCLRLHCRKSCIARNPNIASGVSGVFGGGFCRVFFTFFVRIVTNDGCVYFVYKFGFIVRFGFKNS